MLRAGLTPGPCVRRRAILYRDCVDLISWERRPEPLASPALVAAFKGWNDAGEAATFAAGYLQTTLNAQRFATVNAEIFFDFQSHRPRITIDDGVLTEPIRWPSIELFTTDAAPTRQLIVVQGIEPSMRWPTLTNAILDIAHDLGVRQIVTLGAFLADVPHTRPVRVSGMSHPAELVAPLGVRRPDYSGPTGIVGTFHSTAIDRGFEAVSLWAAVPHYVGAAPSPNAALALLTALARTIEITVDLTDMERAVGHFEGQVNEAVMRNAQASELVTQLEQSFDSEEDLPFGPLPSGDAIAAEFERFLKERSGENDT
jgi:proteasome assembly chaperone (PAC2) family protein